MASRLKSRGQFLKVLVAISLRIFVGGIPSSVTEDELKEFFVKYGSIVEHQIICDHQTNRSRGFGFVVFDSEEVVDELLYQRKHDRYGRH